MLFIVLLIIAYLVGSLSTAIIICKCLGLPDPRQQGSGNPGATNILRLAGKKLAIIVLLGDLLKGLAPVLLAKSLGLPLVLQGWVAFATVIGHVFPLFFGFRGGKGVATAAGALLALSWLLGTAGIATWLMTAVIFRYSSLAAIMAAILTPFYAVFIIKPLASLPILLMSIVLVIRHYKNIQRLCAGKEDKIGSKNSP